VLKKIGINLFSDSTHENKTSRKNLSYHVSELIELDVKRYARDIKNFNYSF